METVARRPAGVWAVVALAVILGLLTLFTHSSPHPTAGRSGSAGASLHGCTSTLESVSNALHAPHTAGGTTTAGGAGAESGHLLGPAVSQEPHPMPGACLAVLIAIAVGLLLGFVLRSLPSRRYTIPPQSAVVAPRPRTVDCLPAARLALCSRLLL